MGATAGDALSLSLSFSVECCCCCFRKNVKLSSYEVLLNFSPADDDFDCLAADDCACLRKYAKLSNGVSSSSSSPCDPNIVLGNDGERQYPSSASFEEFDAGDLRFVRLIFSTSLFSILPIKE